MGKSYKLGLSETELRQLAKEAKKTRRSESNMIVFIVSEWLAKEEAHDTAASR